MKTLLLSFCILSTLAINAQVSKIKNITIDPNLSFQYYEHFKRLTLSSPDSHIEYMDNFNFEWGYTYVVRVKETKLRRSWSDGTSYTYTLKKVISKTKMSDSTQFQLTLDANRYFHKVDSSELVKNNTLKELNDSTFLYFDKVEIEVPKQLKSDFNLIREGRITKRGTFTFINEKRIRLINF